VNPAARRAQRKIIKGSAAAPAKGARPPHPMSMPLDRHGIPAPVVTFADGLAHELRLLGGAG
jgi:hypothetical protein